MHLLFGLAWLGLAFGSSHNLMMCKILQPAPELWANSDFPCETLINVTRNRETSWAIGGAVLARETPDLGVWGRENPGELFYLILMQSNQVHQFRGSECPGVFPNRSASCSSSKYGTKGRIH